MPPVLSDDFKEQVRARTDLVSLIGESLSLTPQRGGNEYVGLCPFHDDHSPSMRIYPDRQTYRCWVCDEGGDCFSWVMKKDGLGFRETLEMLARRANLEVPKTMQRPGGSNNAEKDDLYTVLAWAENEFHRCLLEYPVSAKAREYLKGRGFTDATLAKYKIGFHPNDWSWLLERARNRFSPQQLLAARLVGERDNGGGYYDNFVDRVLFPIHDERGRPVSFGGRILPGNSNPDLPKYWNGPESTVFVKSRLLYGLDYARDAIRKAETVAVTEGYTDCITCHQYGVENVVGTLGTALTETHVIALKRFARKVVLIFDGDDAGQKATERALPKFLAQDVDLRVMTLPGGKDPAEFLEAEGADAFRALMNGALEAWEYKLRAEVVRYGTDSIDARHRVLETMLELLSQAPRLSGSVREDIILSRLAHRLQLSEQSIRQRLQDIRRKNSRQGPNDSGPSYRVDPAEGEQSSSFRSDKLSKEELVEAELLEIIFADPLSMDKIRAQVEPSEFGNLRFRVLLEICCRLGAEEIEATFERVTTELEDPELKRVAVWIEIQAREKDIAKRIGEGAVFFKPGTDEKQTYLDQAIENLKWRRLKQSHERSKGQLAQLCDMPAGLTPDAKDLLRQATEFHQKRVQKKTLT